jgi:hypothetical protein
MTDPAGERTPRRRPSADPARGGKGAAGGARPRSGTSGTSSPGGAGDAPGAGPTGRATARAGSSASEPPGRPRKPARTGAKAGGATTEDEPDNAGRATRRSSARAARKSEESASRKAASGKAASKPAADADGGRPEPERGPGGRWPVADRSLLATVLGVPPIAAVGLAAAFTAIGVLVDLTQTGNLGLVFTICHISGCVLAVVWVRRSGLFGPMVQPPLLVAAAVPAVVLLVGAPRPGQGVAERLLVIGAPLVNAFPMMAWATGAVLAVGLLRIVLQRPV